jgi:hypothetical protein
VEAFEINVHSTITEYEATGQTVATFLQFRIQCLKFLAWAETMRAAWTAACSSGALLGYFRRQPELLDISTPLLKLLKEATAVLKEVQRLKDEYGSFETGKTPNGQLTYHGPFKL